MQTVAQGTDDKILEVIWITIWMKEFLTDFLYHCTNMAVFGGCLHSLSACQQDRKENIPKPKKAFMTYHSPAAASITQPDMKTN